MFNPGGVAFDSISGAKLAALALDRPAHALVTPRFPRLDRPPIAEALLHFEATLGEGVTPDQLRTDETPFRDAHPVEQPIQQVKAEFFFGPDAPADPAMHVGRAGTRYQSEDGGRVAQLTMGGFTYSVVNDYSTWERLVDEALAGFETFQRAVGAAVPVALSTRFINRVELPEGARLGDYLRADFAVPSGVDALLQDFQTRLSFTDRKTGLDAAIALSDGGQREGGGGLVFVDLTAASHHTASWQPGATVPDAVRETLRGLREMKNRLFFDALTPFALGMYLDPS